MFRTFVGVLAVAGALACATEPLEPKPLDITLESSSSTAALGDSISFVVNAQGGSLVGVEIDFGDNTTDTFGTGGATTARITFRHAYQEPATYTVRAVVTDALAGQKEASVEVRVN